MAVATATSLVLQPSFSSPFAVTPSSKLTFPNYSSPRRRIGLSTVACTYVALSSKGQGAFDPELRSVLELATDSELYELERILFGPSYFSPLLKSFTKRADVDYVMIEQDLEEREDFIASLESRFLFLAADARSTLRGWRPSYRNVLLAVRKNLNIPCSSKLSTEDLEAEIFLHLLQEYASEESGVFPGSWENSEASDAQNSLELGLSQWKVQALAAFNAGAVELKSMMLKGGGIYTLVKIYQLLMRNLSGKFFLEAANYQIKKEVLKKGGQLAAINLESRAALLAAKQGFAGAATKYLGLRNMVALLGPVKSLLFSALQVCQSSFLESHYTNLRRPLCFSEKDTLDPFEKAPFKHYKRGFGEHFWQTLLFKCLELTMLEYCEPFMHLLRFVLLAHIGCHQMMSEESGNLRSYFECSHFSSGTIGALQVAFECDECFQCDNVSLM